MTDYRFYHLTRQSLEQVLPDLLQKTLDRGWKAIVKANSPEQVEATAHHLWTFHAHSFLPHGTAKDGQADRQPIWLTTDDERPNNAELLFLTEGTTTANADAYTRVCDLFDGNDPDARAAARQRWSRVKTAGHTPSYWQQNEHGWENKTPAS